MMRDVRRFFSVCLCSLFGLLFGAEARPDNKAWIEFEIITDRRGPVTASHQWARVLNDLNLGRIRIRSGTGAEAPSVRKAGRPPALTYYVTGVVTARNELRLPGGTFGLRDQARLKEWAERLSRGGEAELTAKPAAFGLSSRELAAARNMLSAKVRAPTKGQSMGHLLAEVARSLPVRPVIDPAAARRWRREATVADELEGISMGSALAAALRPLGLALVPERSPSGPPRLRIIAMGKSAEGWPVGWPTEKETRDLAPKIFEFLEVEIDRTPIADVLEAVGGRLELPLLIDHVALAKHQIDPATVLVSLQDRRTYYKKILDRTLAQAKLNWEIRVDDSGQPFLWITTIKR